MTDATVAGPTTDLRLPALYINRELSWLEFNQRVLDEAADGSLSVLERLKFLGIVSSNLDEFFMVRVAGLKVQIEEGVTTTPADGMLPAEQLAAVSARVHRMVADQYRLWREEIRPGMEREHGIRILRATELSGEQAAEARRHFREKVYPLLTPLAHDRSHPFPQLRNKSISLAVQLPRPGARRRRRPGGTMAVVGVPTAAVQRLVPVGGGRAFILVEDLVGEHVSELFFSSTKLRTAAFRVTRNWDLDVDPEEGDDLLALVSEGVRRSDHGSSSPPTRRARSQPRWRASTGSRKRTSTTWTGRSSSRTWPRWATSPAPTTARPAPRWWSPPCLKASRSSRRWAKATSCSTIRTTRSTRWCASSRRRPTIPT
jgi:polyphosphate kinase